MSKTSPVTPLSDGEVVELTTACLEYQRALREMQQAAARMHCVLHDRGADGYPKEHPLAVAVASARAATYEPRLQAVSVLRLLGGE